MKWQEPVTVRSAPEKRIRMEGETSAGGWGVQWEELGTNAGHTDVDGTVFGFRIHAADAWEGLPSPATPPKSGEVAPPLAAYWRRFLKAGAVQRGKAWNNCGVGATIVCRIVASGGWVWN